MQAYLTELDELLAKAERFRLPQPAVEAAMRGLLQKYGLEQGPGGTSSPAAVTAGASVKAGRRGKGKASLKMAG
jgi:hypothetical protein